MKDYFLDLPLHSDVLPKETSNTQDLVSISARSNSSLSLSEGAIVGGIVEITKEVIQCGTDYFKCTEHEKTERKRIASTLKAIVHQIDAQKEIYLKDLEKKYEERNRLYDIALEIQKRALELEDLEMLKISCNFMLIVYNGSTDLKVGNFSLPST